MSKRFSFGIGKRASGQERPNTNDETASVQSESESVISTESWALSDKNQFMSRIARLGGINDSISLDEMLKNLYQDPEILEEKCKASGMNIEPLHRLDEGKLRKVKVKDDGRAGTLLSTKTPETVIKNLDPGYFTADFDPVELQLREVSNLHDHEMTEGFMIMIEDADTDKDMILNKLAKMIEASYSDLVACMRDVHAIDVDLARTGIQMTNSRRKLASAEELLVNGSMKITKLHNFRSRLAIAEATLKSLKSVKDLYQNMQESIRIGNVGTAAECAFGVLQMLQIETYEHIEAIQEYGVGVQEQIPKIRQKSDKALDRLCGRKFSSADMNNILTAYLILDQMSEEMGVQVVDQRQHSQSQSSSRQESIIYDSFGCLDGLGPRIQRFLQADIESCIRISLLEFIHMGQTRRSGHPSQSLNMNAIDNSASNRHQQDLADCPLQTLYNQLLPDMIVTCVIRTCELLTDVIHTLHQIVQWLRSPFDDRNADPAFLHRRIPPHYSKQSNNNNNSNSAEGQEVVEGWPDEDEDGSDDTSDSSATGESSEQSTANDTRSSAILSSYSEEMDEDPTAREAARQRRLRKAQLSSAFSELRDSRRPMWDLVINSIIELLRVINIPASVPVEDFLAMTWVIQAVVRLGKEFCGSESKSLLTCLRKKSVEYISQLHKECFKLFKQMVDSETWKSVPVRLNEIGGIIGVIKMNLKRDLSSRLNDQIRIRGMLREARAAQRKYAVLLAAKYNTAPTRIPPRNGTVGSSHIVSLTNNTVEAKPQQGGEGEGEPAEDDSMMMSFALHGNPLHLLCEGEELEAEKGVAGVGGAVAVAADSGDLTGGNNAPNLLLLMLDEDQLLNNHKRSSAMVVTQSALNGLAKYAGKYLQLMHVIGTVAQDVFTGLGQLFDFYLCAVFVGFVPTEDRQRCLSRHLPRQTSPAPVQSKDFEALSFSMQRVLATGSAPSQHSSNLTSSFGESRDHSDGATDMDLTSSTVASSLSSQLQQTGWLVNKLLPRPAPAGNTSTDSMVSLNEHIVAAESCWFAAKLIDELKPKILKLLPTQSSKDVCENFVSDYLLVAGQLRALVYKTMCPRLLSQNVLLSQVSESSNWDMKRMREDPHDWVETIVSKCKEIWQYLVRGEEFAEASSLVREQVWLELCQAAFDIVLEGFSRVKKVSTEGRASMAMDVSSLHTALDGIHPCRPPRGKLHVDNFVRASYLSEEEVLEWVRNNWQGYAYRHLLGLLTQVYMSNNNNMNVNVLKKKRYNAAVAVLDGFYDQNQRDEMGGIKDEQVPQKQGPDLTGLNKLVKRFA